MFAYEWYIKYGFKPWVGKYNPDKDRKNLIDRCRRAELDTYKNENILVRIYQKYKIYIKYYYLSKYEDKIVLDSILKKRLFINERLMPDKDGDLNIDCIQKVYR